MRAVDVIEKKKRGGELSSEEIRFMVQGYVEGTVPDYQMSAFLMAVFFQKMTSRETYELTMAMAESGDYLDLSAIEGIKVDKHSSGGVGDKTSLILAPMVAALDIPVAKMSGRGLGHTGGTIDKMESIPGFNTTLSMETFFDNVNRIKIAITGQTGNLAPADKKIYALRDVTGTVDNISLISSSIMSKKIASGADAIVLDVKCGSGAFMKDLDDATELAATMVDIGKSAGRQTAAVISDMNQPLGNAVGNSLEIIEVIETLKNNGPADLTELCLVLGSYMVMFANKAASESEARAMLEEVLRNGKALDKFREFVKYQNGDESVADDYSLLPAASIVRDITLAQLCECESGYIQRIDCEGIGLSAMLLGGGRAKKEDVIDMAVGVVVHKKTGDYVKAEDVVLTIHANHEDKLVTALNRLRESFVVGADRPQEQKLIKRIIV